MHQRRNLLSTRLQFRAGSCHRPGQAESARRQPCLPSPGRSPIQVSATAHRAFLQPRNRSPMRVSPSRTSGLLTAEKPIANPRTADQPISHRRSSTGASNRHVQLTASAPSLAFGNSSSSSCLPSVRGQTESALPNSVVHFPEHHTGHPTTCRSDVKPHRPFNNRRRVKHLLTLSKAIANARSETAPRSRARSAGAAVSFNQLRADLQYEKT